MRGDRYFLEDFTALTSVRDKGNYKTQITNEQNYTSKFGKMPACLQGWEEWKSGRNYR